MSWHGKYFKGASRERKLQKREEAEERQANRKDETTQQSTDAPRSS